MSKENLNTQDPQKKDDPEANPLENGDPAPAGGETPPEIYRPEGLPDHYAGGSDQETIDKLFKAVDGFRKEQAGKKGIPEKIEDYTVDFGDKADSLLLKSEDGKDPVWEKMRGKFFEKGIAPEDVKDIVLAFDDIITEMAGEQQQVTEGSKADWDYETYGGADKAKTLLDGVMTWADGMKAQGKFTDADLKEIQLATTNSEGLGLWMKIRELSGEKPIPVSADGGSKSPEITQDVLNQRVADPRYRPDSREYDPVFRKETEEMFKKLYANES